MKRVTVFFFALLLLTSTAFAAETQRYIVGTKRAFTDARGFQNTVDSVELRGARGFSAMNGFAANLTQDEVETLRASGEVRFVEPVVPRYALDVKRNLKGQTIPYGIDAVLARQAFDGTRKARINVAVIDTGVDYNHPELKDIYAGGYNVFNDSNNPLDDHGHGTHVSGTIAAAHNNIGVIGVAPDVRLWSVKMLNATGSGDSEGIIESLEWILKKKSEFGGNWVVNMSLGSNNQSEAEREVFNRVRAAGIIVIAAAGNSSSPGHPAPVGFPAAYDNVIAVAATDNERKLAYFSSQGPEVEFSAPGVDVLSTVPIGDNFLAYVQTSSDTFEVSPVGGSIKGSMTAEYVLCGIGAPGDCPASVAGKIALIQRGGDISFANKVRVAKAAGAAAVVIYNHDQSTNTNWTLFSDAAAMNETWPLVLRLTKAQGEELKAKGSGHQIHISYDLDDYGELSGTSMASPHVAGAFALLWSLAPDATPDQIYAALANTAVDLGPAGRDSEFGIGQINIFTAAKTLSPSSFPVGSTTGRGMGRRGGK